MKIPFATFLVVALAPQAALFAQGSASIPAGGPQRPDYERYGAGKEVAVTLAAVGTLVSIDDGVIQVDISGKRFQSKPDEGTRFVADKKTPLAGRKDLSLADFPLGFPVKLTFVAETGQLLEMRLRYEKPKAAASER